MISNNKKTLQLCLGAAVATTLTMGLTSCSSTPAPAKEPVKASASNEVFTRATTNNQISRDQYRQNLRTVINSKTVSVPFKKITKNDPNSYKGTTKIAVKGKNGSNEILTREYYWQDDLIQASNPVTKIVLRPVDQVTLVGTKPVNLSPIPAAKPYTQPVPKSTPKPTSTPTATPTPTSSSTPQATATPSGPDNTSSIPTPGRVISTPPPANDTTVDGMNLARSDMWDKIAWCETGQRWNLVATNSTGTYYGGLMMLAATWNYWGGQDFAPTANLATRAQQITVANRIYADLGLKPWSCRGAANS